MRTHSPMLRGFIVALAMFAATSCTHSVSLRHVPTGITVKGGDVELTVEWCRGLPFVPVMIDGAGPFWMVLDTGAMICAVDREAAARLPNPIMAGKINVTGSSGQAAQSHGAVRMGLLEIGDYAARDVDAAVMDLTEVKHALGRSVDGVLGTQIFRGIVLNLDYPSGQIHVTMRDLVSVPDGEWVENPGSVRPYVEAIVHDQPFTLLIDSGSGGAIDLPVSQFAEDHFISSSHTMSAGVAATSFSVEGRVNGQAEIDSLIFADPVIELTPDKEGRIGARVLRNFSLYFDSERDRVALVSETNEPITTGPVYHTGFFPRRFPDTIEVRSILEGGAAEECGLMEGDRIESINGIPVRELHCDISLGKDSGEPLTLSGQTKNGAPFEVILTPQLVIP